MTSEQQLILDKRELDAILLHQEQLLAEHVLASLCVYKALPFHLNEHEGYTTTHDWDTRRTSSG